MRLGRPRWRQQLVAGSALVLSMAAPAGAGDITAFVSVATPRENWSRGYGAALSIVLLLILIVISMVQLYLLRGETQY